jgi:hypothetical protein
MRCQHRCAHCYVDDTHGGVEEMPDEVLNRILEKSATAGLLATVTLLGGEPFINPVRLLGIIRKIWKLGAGTLEIFVPTNARWVAEAGHEDVVKELVTLAQWFPYGLRVAFSRNEWNLAQLGGLAALVQEQWADLETRYPEIFYHRTLTREEVLPLGGVREKTLAVPATHVGVNCDFDDWYDPGQRSGFLTDYLAFYPNGECGLCCVYHSPVIGTYDDSFSEMLLRRRQYLPALRRRLTGDEFGSLPPEACLVCKDFYAWWLREK